MTLQLHWLPFTARIEFKVLLLVLKSQLIPPRLYQTCYLLSGLLPSVRVNINNIIIIINIIIVIIVIIIVIIIIIIFIIIIIIIK